MFTKNEGYVDNSKYEINYTLAECVRVLQSHIALGEDK